MVYSLIQSAPQNGPSPRMEDIELSSNTGYDPGQQRYAPPAGRPPGSDSKDKLSQSEQPLVTHWPVTSQRVAAITPLRATIIVFDVILASTPIMFIALALVAARLDGKEVSSYGTELKRVLLLSPTIFPIIFAALMGRCFKHVGLYLAERGTTLGRLEQLVGCQSLFSAVERQLVLRSWSIVGLVLVLIWLLSPLGGQSALRLLDTEGYNVQTMDTYHYLNPVAHLDSFLGGASGVNSGRSTFSAIFLSALLSSSKYQNTPMDLWGNVKMPAYRAIENTTTTEWKIVPDDGTTDITYASLIGIPVAGIHDKGESDFNIKARQFDITCSSNELMTRTEKNFGNVTNATWKLNRTASCFEYPCAINFKSLTKDYNISVSECELTYLQVEATIRCNGKDCRASSMRQIDTYDDTYTNDTDAYVRGTMMANEMNSLPTVDNYGVGSAASRGSTNMEKWMLDPWDFIGVAYGNVDLYTLPPEVLAERLTILWNSFFQSTYATTAIGGNLPQNLTQLSADNNEPQLTFNKTRAGVTISAPPIYKTSWRWFSTLLLASILLQIAAYTGLVLKYITLAPDIIGYASSMTMLNPYVPTPTGGTTLHGLERAALLHDLPVRIGDVCANEPVGAIAFAKADEGRVSKLDRRRWYI